MYIVADGDKEPGIAVYDVESRALTRLPRMSGVWPAWTPDGKRIAYTGWTANGMRAGRAMWVVADGASAPEAIPGTEVFGSSVIHVAFTPDGKSVVVRAATSPGDSVDKPHAYAVPLGGGPPVPIIVDTPQPDNLAVSPDGKWIAYSTSAPGERPEVFVRPFPGGRGTFHVSVCPVTRRDVAWRAEALLSRVRGRLPCRDARLERQALARSAHGLSAVRPVDDRGDSLDRPGSGRKTICGDAFCWRGLKLNIATNWTNVVREKLAGK